MKILHIDCSPRPTSHSRALSAVIVQRLLNAYPQASVIRRDLGQQPIPHPSAKYATLLSSPAALAIAATDEALRLSEGLICEVETANFVVIGTPVNNFTVPSVLKAWIDHVVRIGRTFAATPSGKTGLLQDRPMLFAIASGGVISGPRASQPDFLTPYLTTVMNSIGLKTLHFLHVQATAFPDEERGKDARCALLRKLDAIVSDGRRSDASLHVQTTLQ